VKKCGFLFFVVEGTSLAVNETALVVEADVALVVADVAFTGGTLVVAADVDSVADVVFIDVALDAGAGGAAGAGADEPQKSGPVPH
jgi:hypothetical protein